MQFGDFWIMVYDLQLKLWSKTMAKQLGNIIGHFEEMDLEEAYTMGKFMHIKVKVDIRKPLKRWTIIKYQNRRLKVFFKYERLPTFCFACGRIGNQLKNCEDLGDSGVKGFNEIKENNLFFRPWLRTSPLPRNPKGLEKEQCSGSFSRNVFKSSNLSKGSDGGKDKEVGKERKNPGRKEWESKHMSKEYSSVSGENK